MDLLTFIADGERKARLAALTGSSEGYLWQIATKWRGKRPSPELAQAIERESGAIGPEAVPKGSLRPDLWTDQSVHRTPAATPGGAAEAAPVTTLSEAA